MRNVTTLLAALLAALLLAAGCGGQSEAGAPATPADTGECPITIPSGGFRPPDGFPLQQDQTVERGDLWYGSDALWTLLPAEGDYLRRKSVWWSVNFPGGTVEERPALTVTWTRLDGGTEDVRRSAEGTNAYTAEDGWFMISGIDPEDPGCWLVEAAYKGATLSYVYLGG